MDKLLKNPRTKKSLIFLLVLLSTTFIFLFVLYRQMIESYEGLQSVIVTDRNDKIIAIKPNFKGNYTRYSENVPDKFSKLLISKEDRFFYFHLGINPISTLRAGISYIKNGRASGSSTITQQLAKNLLNNEQDRTVENKLTEAVYAIALEIFSTKKEVLNMYLNTVYMGNQIQGLETASNAYFGKKLDDLNDTEALSLLATISSPSNSNPWTPENLKVMNVLSERLQVNIDLASLIVAKKFQAVSSANFELNDLVDCKKYCKTTIDLNLTDKIRETLARNITLTSRIGGRNGAVVVIKLPENELVSIVGTPSTKSNINGSAINMAVKPRPIGSTIKPFVYLKAFELGLRPYTLVDDREYKFSIETGFPLYPKNYDGTYHGVTTLHESLSNSLNVPTVKTLEYISLEEFYNFLENTLKFKSISPIESYQYGIALGGLEMDPLTLAHLFTIFGNKGELLPLKIFVDQTKKPLVPSMETDDRSRKVSDDSYVQLVNKITSDRISGVEQFGLNSNLNLPQSNYAVKTGTSRDFHDTWTIGFTPDFLVAVWLGNVENEPMQQITSSTGAGKIWHDVMEILIASDYNKSTPLDFSKLKPIEIDQKLEYGLPNDNVEYSKNLLSDKSLISNPHDGDTFLLEKNTEIKLKSKFDVLWFVDGQLIGTNSELSFHPSKAKTYKLKAKLGENEEEISLRVTEE